MTEQTKNQDIQTRRAFLKSAGVAGVAAAVSVVTTDDAEAQNAAPEKTTGYRETDHVAAYYKAAKF